LQLEPGWAWLITPQESVGPGSRMVGDLNPSTSSSQAAKPAGSKLGASSKSGANQISSKSGTLNQISTISGANQLIQQIGFKYAPKPSSSEQASPKAGVTQSPSSNEARRPLSKSAANKSKEEALRIENLDEQSPKKAAKKLTKDEVSKLVERALENAKRKKEVEEADSEMVVRKKKSHLMEDLKVYFAMALLLLIAGGIIVAKINMEPQSARNGTFVPLEQETGSSAKYTASGFIPDHPGYIA